jgi:hypothetical protein
MMEQWKIELILPLAIREELERIARAAGHDDAVTAAKCGLIEWVAQRKEQLDNHDPSQKYFINEALDELFAGKK